MKVPTLVKASNPVFANAEGTAIMLDTVFDELEGEHKFLAKADDPEGHGVNLFCRAATGEFGPISPYEEPAEKPLSVTDLAKLKVSLIEQLEQELYRRMPMLGAFRKASDAINAASTATEAQTAFFGVQWPDGGNGNGFTR